MLFPYGSRDVRKKVINGDYEFVVINYDGVETVVDELKNKFELVILDEANYIKNVSTVASPQPITAEITPSSKNGS